jgi:hypothetical protein
MAVSTLSGPQVTFGITLTSCGIDLEHNPDRGPSVADLGEGLLDPRPPFMFAPGQASSKPFFAWAGLFGGPVVDQAPSATSTNVIAATQVPVGGTALTLNANTSQGFGAAVTINAYEGGTATVRPIDGAMTGLAFGISGGINLWNPTTAISRTLTFFGSSNGSSAEAWSIAGRDIYGQKMTELVLGASTGQSSNVGASTKKAYKYIASIVPSTVNGSIGSTLVTVGTNDVFGFPLRVDHPGYVTAWAGATSSATLITASSASIHTLAVTATPTSTTGDVRGTLGSSTVGSVSNSSNFKIVMFISPSAQNLQGVSLGSSYPAGIVGQLQFSSV